MTKVDVVVPVYNEERALPISIPILREFLVGGTFPYDWQILIADNASIDDTPAVSRKLELLFPDEVKYVRIERKGRGYALKQVWGDSTSDVMSYMDVDLSTGLDAFPALITAVAEDGYGVSTGSRLARKSKTKRSLQRTVLSRGYNMIIKAMMWTKFSDAQCGFKAINREAAGRILPLIQNNNWFFDTELLVLAEKMGYRVKSIPVKWDEDTDTRVKIGSTVSEDLKGLWRMRREQPWRDG